MIKRWLKLAFKATNKNRHIFTVAITYERVCDFKIRGLQIDEHWSVDIQKRRMAASMGSWWWILVWQSKCKIDSN